MHKNQFFIYKGEKPLELDAELMRVKNVKDK